MRRIHIPVKPCGNPKKHEAHEWRENKVFLRECNGRTSDKENCAARRARIRSERRARK